MGKARGKARARPGQDVPTAARFIWGNIAHGAEPSVLASCDESFMRRGERALRLMMAMRISTTTRPRRSYSE